MNKQKLEDLLSLFAVPAILCIAGLILPFRPDSAAALIARVLGWGIFLLGVGCCFGAIFGRSNTVVKILGAIVFLCLGSWLIRNPMAPAAFVGYLLGLWLVIEGAHRIRSYRDRGWGLVTMVLGAALLLLPLTASRLVFSLCGLVMLLAGAAMLLSRLRNKRLEAGNDDPNIIDAL